MTSVMLKLFSLRISILILALEMAACNFAPGSYPNAEVYELEYPEEMVKSTIREFKQEHPEYNPPKVTINGEGSWDLLDETTRDPPHWYKFYFYYKNENKIIYTWIRSDGKSKTKFALISVNEGTDLPNWREINKDFERRENIGEKMKFELRILSKITEKLDKENSEKLKILEP